MKVELLKKIIKEAVKEGIREEIKELISKEVKPVSEIKADKVFETKNFNKINNTTDPLSEMINMTRTSMASDDYKNILNYQSSDVQTFMNGISRNDNFIPSNNTQSHPGLDLSTLDFVKNASKVFQASLEKDKKKNGI